MVLRGSKTHPQYDLYEVRQAIDTAKEYLDQTEIEKKELEHEIAEVIHEEVAHLRDGGPDGRQRKNIEIETDLTNAIRILIDRIEDLEDKQKEAASLIDTYQKELKISLQQLACGGIAGMTARTIVAPIDRVKLLIQTAGVRGTSSLGIVGEATKAVRDAGIRSLWKGNFTNCIRVFPYAALQFASYERYKSMIVGWTEENGREFGTVERLMSGGCAGATAATLTYPLDVMRVRQAVFNEIKGPRDAIRSIYADGGVRAFYKGWTPTLVSLAPFIAINFATFDYLKSTFIPDGNTKAAHPLLVLGLGAGAGLFAQSICYPLDTVRRQMQMPGRNFTGIVNCVTSTIARDGIVGMYRGIVPNAIKIVPNNGIRFFVFTKLTAYLDIPTTKVRPKKPKD